MRSEKSENGEKIENRVGLTTETLDLRLWTSAYGGKDTTLNFQFSIIN